MLRIALGLMVAASVVLGCGGTESDDAELDAMQACNGCLPGDVCVEGRCQEMAATSNGATGTSSTTTTSEDGCGASSAPCGDGEVCALGVCAEACPCESPLVCDEALSVCVAECNEDGACDEGFICEAEVCVEGCRFDGACSEGQICQESVCVEGCRNPSDCPDFHFCRNRVCEAWGCQEDFDCSSGARCDPEERVCVEVGAAPCETDEMCGHTWRCSVTGVCIEEQCAVNADCDHGAWCQEGICVPRETLQGPVGFERYYPEHVSTHASGYTNLRLALTYGYGAALFDMDGDLDLDLFLGTIATSLHSEGFNGASPCIFRNVSQPGEVRFEPVDTVCPMTEAFAAAYGVDLEGDGFDELVLQGESLLKLVRFHPELTITDLQVALDDDARLCQAGAMVATDLDFDGLVDILVGCQGYANTPLDSTPNLPFRQHESGELVPFGEELSVLGDEGMTLGLGALDLNGDGLLDIVAANDSFSLEGVDIYYDLGRGVSNVRCAPDDACAFEVSFFDTDDRAWGSYMGVGNVHIDGHGNHLYVADWGPNRVVRYEEGQPVDVALEFGIDLGWNEGFPIFSWGVIVEDFDRNGLDDLWVSQGPVAINSNLVSPPAWQQHRSMMLLQTSGGLFNALSEEVGIEPTNQVDAQREEEERWHSARASVKADLDGDGLLDIIELPLEGVPRFYRERATDEPPRCTLVPRSTFVPGYGVGYAVAAEGSEVFRTRDMQGQLRFGASPWVISSEQRGTLRFPSGAEVLFDCEGTPGPVVVEEPAWIEVTQDDRGLLIRVDAPWAGVEPDISAVVRSNEGQVSDLALTAEGAGLLRAEAEGSAVMIRVNGRYVGRWFGF